MTSSHDSLTTQTILIIFITLFCGVFTVLLAVWHKDTHHSRQPQSFEPGNECSICPSVDLEDKFCAADFALTARIKGLVAKSGDYARSYSMRKLRTFKSNELFPFVWKKRQIVVNTTEPCNFSFQLDHEYFLSGKLFQVDSGKYVAIISACDLIFQWTGLSTQSKQQYIELFREDQLCGP